MGRETAKETVSAMTDDRACFKCGKTGHIRRDCPLRQKKSGGDDANKVKWALAVSDRSLSKSLADEEKPNKAMGRETAKETVSAMTDDRACFKCGKTGHIRRDCPLRQKKSGGDDANKVKWALAVSDRSLSKVLLAKGASRLTKGKPLQAWRR
ncbi:hypothetical protein PF003_g20299 [Phytophthora fragariae]|nr:hypothetical protein PF003_g20299 [Phytophthora fragariae]